MKRRCLTAVYLMMLAVLLSGCRRSTPEQRTVSLSGSSSMEQAVCALGEDFMSRGEILVEAQFGGSSQGLRDAAEGKTDIGCASRGLTAEEEALLDAVVIGIDGIVVIVHKENPIIDLSLEQLADIYTGAVRNWKEVGGEDSPIVVIGRDAASGTRIAFEELLDISGQCIYAQEKDSSGGIRISVETTPEAIGYVSLEAADGGKGIKKLSLDGVKADEENLLTGEYTLSRPFLMAVKKGEVREEVKAFLDYVLSGEGQAVISSQKLVPIQKHLQ